MAAPNTAAPLQPVLFDPDDTPTTARLDIRYSGFLAEAQRPQLNNYIRHAEVGRGQHGSVYLCHRIDPTLPIGHPQRRLPVAMKSVKRNNPRAEQLKALRRETLPASPHTPLADRLATTEVKIRKEIAIMKKLRHPHVVRLYEIIDDRLREKIYIVMEYLGGGEVKWHDGDYRPVLTVAQTRRILRDAVLGLEYLHHQGIIHRDIKPANLLWTDDRRQVKIGDFGVSHFCYAQRLATGTANAHSPGGGRGDDDLFQDDADLTRRAGTPAFLAPEIVWEHTRDPRTGAPLYLSSPSAPASSSSSPVLNNTHTHANAHTPYNTKTHTPVAVARPAITASIDVWALGVTLFCLLAGDTPFLAARDAQAARDEYALYSAICNDAWAVPAWVGCERVGTARGEGREVMELLERFLRKGYGERITLDGVKATPWVTADLPAPARFAIAAADAAPRIAVSTRDAAGAMSAVHFRWRWGLGRQLARGVGMLLRGVGASTTASSASASSAGLVAGGGGGAIAGPAERRAIEGPGAGGAAGRTLRAHRSAGWGRRREREREEAEDVVGVVSAPQLRGWKERERAREREREREKGKGKERESRTGKERESQAGKEHERQTRPPLHEARSLRALSPERWLEVRAGAGSTSTSALPAAGPSAHPHTHMQTTSTTVATTTTTTTATPPTTTNTTTTNTTASAPLAAPAPRKAGSSTSTGTRVAIPPRRGALSAPASPTLLLGTEGSAAAAGERRARFAGLFQIANWRPTKYARAGRAGGGASPASASGSGAGGAGVGAGAAARTAPGVGVGRRSEEALALRHYPLPAPASASPSAPPTTSAGTPLSVGGGGSDILPATALAEAHYADDDAGAGARLTAARRAASWGQGDKEEYAELVSVKSVEHGLNAQEMNVGAGGVFVARRGAGGAVVGGQGAGYAQGGGYGPGYASGYGGAYTPGMHVMLPDADSRGASSPASPASASAFASPFDAHRAVDDVYARSDDDGHDHDHDHDHDDHDSNDDDGGEGDDDGSSAGSGRLVYAPAEQAEDNLRFGPPAWHRPSSLDGSSDGERDAARRRRGGLGGGGARRGAPHGHGGPGVHAGPGAGHGVHGHAGAGQGMRVGVEGLPPPAVVRVQSRSPGLPARAGLLDDHEGRYRDEDDDEEDEDEDDSTHEGEDDDSDDEDDVLIVRRPSTRRILDEN